MISLAGFLFLSVAPVTNSIVCNVVAGFSTQHAYDLLWCERHQIRFCINDKTENTEYPGFYHQQRLLRKSDACQIPGNIHCNPPTEDRIMSSVPAYPSFAALTNQGVPVGGSAQLPPAAAPAAAGVQVAGGAPAAHVALDSAAPPTPSAPASLLRDYESRGLVPPNRFQSDAELVHGLYELAQTLATDRPEPRAAATPPPAVPDQVAQQPPAEDIARVATAFQQQGLLSFANGQWVATNPMAGEVAAAMNRRNAEAQARQAELSDPSGFIRKYGADVFKQMVDPLHQQVQTLIEENKRLQESISSLAPKPYASWIKENQAKLYTVDPQTGSNVLSPAGNAYHAAWGSAAQAGVTDEAALHHIAMTTANPYMAVQVQQTAQPAKPWSASLAVSPDNGFNAPGSAMGRQAGSTGVSVPVGPDGMPSFRMMLAQGVTPQ